MYKTAVIGDRESISGFAALGSEIFFETEPEKISRLIHQLAQNNFAVIFITESAASDVDEAINRYRYSELPAIILIPGTANNTGEGMKNLNESVLKAVGIDIFK